MRTVCGAHHIETFPLSQVGHKKLSADDAVLEQLRTTAKRCGRRGFSGLQRMNCSYENGAHALSVPPARPPELATACTCTVAPVERAGGGGSGAWAPQVWAPRLVAPRHKRVEVHACAQTLCHVHLQEKARTRLRLDACCVLKQGRHSYATRRGGSCRSCLCKGSEDARLLWSQRRPGQSSGACCAQDLLHAM
jgi:hypothetical protein